MLLPFNKPYLTGKEAHYMYQAVYEGHLSGNGAFTKKSQKWFETHYNFHRCLLTSSCTDALEMASLLLKIQPGDEVIVPSYTFVSTANAFVLRGAVIRFVDSLPDQPNIDPTKIEEVISEKTKAIVVVHYAGVAVDMDPVLELAKKHNIFVVEDAAQGVDAYYKDRPLGGIGDLGTFSFHETKNIISGEGGMLVVNNQDFEHRAEIIWEKGTNRAAFFRGDVDKYGWVDMGSSFLPSEVIAAFLYAQLEHLENIQTRRMEIWHRYQNALLPLAEKGLVQLPHIPGYARHNAHMFYLLCRNLEERTGLIQYLRDQGVVAVFHYLSLHKSPFFEGKHDGRELPHSDRYTNTLVRLPFFYELSHQDQDKVVELIYGYFKSL